MPDEQLVLPIEFASALSTLRQAVDRHALPMLLSAYGNTQATEHLIRLHLSGLPAELAILSRLLILGDEVATDSLREVVECEALERLVDHGLFTQRENAFVCHFKVVMAAGLLIFAKASAPKPKPTSAKTV